VETWEDVEDMEELEDVEDVERKREREGEWVSVPNPKATRSVAVHAAAGMNRGTPK
jgi:hypothetical protein